MTHGELVHALGRATTFAALGTAVALIFSGCSSSDAAAGPRPTESTMVYVAMGDSYTSAPGIAGEYSADGCLRSPRNYPSMVAAALEVDELVDVSCSGAQTRQMRMEHVTEAAVLPPQLDALDVDTDLITLSIGANDYGLFSTLVRRCSALAELDPRGAPCAEDQASGGYDKPTMQVTRIRDRVAAAITEITTRAPKARVIVVGYPQLIPDEGRCPSRIRLADGDYAYVRTRLTALSNSIEAGAEFAGAEYVNLLGASDGFDVCSKRPWMNGAVEKPDRALPYHPYPAEQRAVADLILSRVDAS